MIANGLLLVFPLLLAIAAFFDLFTMTIPNKLNLVLILSFFAMAFLLHMPIEQVAMSFALGLGVMIVGFGLFALGLMGGGDVKFLAAISLWFGHSVNMLEFILLMSIYGGVLTLIILALRKVPYFPQFMQGQAWLLKLHDKQSGVPYGIAIAIAGIQVYPNTSWFLQIPAL
ncbi:Type IV leader peptidase family protein [Pseudovibrio axinellae]|uniref:Type IV leader peptidase family protein n=1 Tax=Pseudovibrio axinellae TaxID=989403 RepID=A0A166B7T2_9HYPH|nr:prepilin peptidase [Pseudovibrio axinellae]KZL21995.1 Type IV leader peptidase family protein [Pseudovibrio axinellae]SEQ59439.1 prepilin peptidase CpaA [Pseudovibrio axinellae]